MAAVITALAAIAAPRPAAADGTVWYVSPSGSDAAAGTVGAPFRTIAKALRTVGPGQTVLVRGGVYAERLRGISVAAGRSDARIRLAAYPGERPVVSGLLWLSDADYWTVDGINVTWNEANAANEHMVKFSDGVGWRYTNAEVWGARSYAGILVAGDPAGWKLDHLYVHDTHLVHSGSQDHLIYVNTGMGGGRIEFNVLADSPGGRAIKIGPSSDSTHPVGNVLVRYNTMDNNRGPSNIQLSYGASGNRITRNLLSRPAPGRENITAYNLNGSGNSASNNAGWASDGVVESDPRLADGGGNRVIDPLFADAAGGDFRPRTPSATDYGAHAQPAALAETPRPPTEADGYRVVASDGGIFSFGDARFHGSTGGMRLARPIVGMATTPSGRGYWLVASDGGIFAFGDARFRGSTGGTRLARPIVGMARTPSGRGYWLVASDGGIFAFGDARFRGSTGGMRLARPIVGMASTPSGRGYWLVASDGGIFAFGDARFFGSTGGIRLHAPITQMAPGPRGRGYWLVASDGGVFPFGTARFHGSGAGRLPRPVVGIAPAEDGRGYWLVSAAGRVLPRGSAAVSGSVSRPSRPMVGIDAA